MGYQLASMNCRLHQEGCLLEQGISRPSAQVSLKGGFVTDLLPVTGKSVLACTCFPGGKESKELAPSCSSLQVLHTPAFTAHHPYVVPQHIAVSFPGPIHSQYLFLLDNGV